MRFLIDECLHESEITLGHAAGFETTHVNHLGLSGKPDWVLAERIIKDEFTFVTNNRADFIRLFGKMDVHPGLIVLVPNAVPAALEYSIGRDLINTLIEVNLDGEIVRCTEYQLPRN